ncbi:hypothetical protein GCM10022206_56550 [Streptomyces chiangmaiensis]
MVTGAGSGIGRAVAVELLRAGWSVTLAGRRTGTLEETAALVPEGSCLAVRADVSEPGDATALFAAVRDRFGRLDLLFNNAGTFGPGGVPVENLSYEAWRHVVDTNLNGAFLCAQEAYRQMKEQEPQGGRIINNGSISAHTPRPRSVAYTATKHAVTGLTKSLSLDGRPYRIAVGQIDIGNAATDMTARIPSGVPQANGELAVEPVMDVSDVARTVRHMAELPLEANVQFATVLATTIAVRGPRLTRPTWSPIQPAQTECDPQCRFARGGLMLDSPPPELHTWSTGAPQATPRGRRQPFRGSDGGGPRVGDRGVRAGSRSGCP